MDLAALKKQAEQGRLSWHDVDTKSYQIKRPTQLDLIDLSRKETGIETMLESAELYIVDWKGFTQSDFGVDGDDVVPFDKELLQIYLKDNFATANKLLNTVWEQVKGFEQEKKS